MRQTLIYLAPLLLSICVGAAAQPDKKTGPDAKASQPSTSDKPAAKPAAKPFNPTKKAAAEDTESDKLLDETIKKIEALKQFRAEVRQVTEMFGYKFTADGQYAVGPDFRMLFELKVRLTDPDTTGTMKEVCDGRVHWRHQQVLDTANLTRTDLKRLREVLDKPQFNNELRDQLIREFGFSGIAPLLKGLRETQRFTSHKEDKLDDADVYVLEGGWKEDVIGRTVFRGQQLSMANLPSYVPSKTTLWIGREDGWPHRVRMESEKKAQGSKTVVTLEFLNPQIGVDLPESLFIFEPPSGIRPEDQTESLYQTLNTILQQQQAAPAAPTKPSGATTPPATLSPPTAAPPGEPTKKP
jgi:hypothetical protein